METVSQQLARSAALHRQIMRRVWYAYLLSIFMRPAFVMGLAFGASAIAFWKLVSITSIVQNTLSAQVGEVPSYVLNSLMQAEFFALITFAIIVTVGLMMTVRLVALLREVSVLDLTTSRA